MRVSRRRVWLQWAIGLALTGQAVAPEAVLAVEISSQDGSVHGSFDTTLTVGTTLRLEGQDPAIIGRANGGRANSVNVDDGDLNYEPADLTSLQARASHELDLAWRNFGFFGRAFYFYDLVVSDFETARTPIPDAAKDIAGHDLRLQDAFVDGSFELAGRPLTVRIGNQVLNWGESTFIPNGINGLNAIDVSQLRVAGAEIRNALEAVPTIDVDVGLTRNLSLEGFYQFLHRKTRIEPNATFFSTSDPLSAGGDRLFLGFGEIPDCPPPPPTTNAPIGPFVPRGADDEAPDLGQFGLALRYFAEDVNATEFGLYYLNYHSNMPFGSLVTGTEEGLLAGNYAGSGRYFVAYPKDIHLLGASFNTALGAGGLALQGELSYRPNQPLQIDDVELLFAGLSPANPAVFGQGQLGVFGFEREIDGFRREDVLQAQVTASQVLGPNLGADQIFLIGEIGATWVPGLPDQDELRFDGPGTFTSGNPFFTEIGVQPETQQGGFATRFSWGYRLLARADFLGALGPVSLAPQLAFAHDVGGTTPRPLGNFVAGRKALTLSIAADYLNSLRGELAYTGFYGANGFNLLRDRDFVSLSISYAF